MARKSIYRQAHGCTLPQAPWPELKTIQALHLLNQLAASADGYRQAQLKALLDEVGPTPVRRGVVPRWLVAARKDLPCLCRCGRSAKLVLAALSRFTLLANPGSTLIAGLECLVTEPYRDESDKMPAVLVELGQRLGRVHACASQGAWDAGTVRGILFPVQNLHRLPRGPATEEEAWRMT